jgi:hypothetical protein
MVWLERVMGTDGEGEWMRKERTEMIYEEGWRIKGAQELLIRIPFSFVTIC